MSPYNSDPQKYLVTITMNPRTGKRGNGSRKSVNGSARRNSAKSNRSGPAEFVPTLSLGHRFRFSSPTASLGLPILRQYLLNLVTMATTTSVQHRIIDAIKLNRVQVWSQPPVLGGVSTPIVVEWVGNHSPSTIHSDTAIGVRPGFVDSVPPADSSNRWWSISGTDEGETLFKVSCPAGSVIDVTCTLRLIDDEAAVLGEAGTGGASTVGTIYFNYLDSFSSKALLPTGGVRVLP